jgi:CubicO group peptidase (beta-lactamase class C family)
MKIFTALLLLILIPSTLPAQMNDESRLMEIETTVLDYLAKTDPSHLQNLLSYFKESDESTIDERTAQLENVKTELAAFLGDVGIEGSPNGLKFYFSNDDHEKILFVAITNNGFIESLRIEDSTPSIALTVELLPKLVDSLSQNGYSGLLYARKGGEMLVDQPFGMANPGLNIPNTKETIFATGSRPIDYTIASILLLAQQDKLSLDDTLDRYFDGVPKDKQSMTIEHLMTGRSGLPDFFDIESDWDADLGWIDREEATERLITIDLLFEPGTNRQHSHAAFGLLAIVIEKVSGMDYYAFIRKNFFDPAGMERTGEYGETRGFELSDFAEGKGPQRIGIPNIPPNWGPTSWLIKGSGGMYSTLEDLRAFYAYLRSGDVLDEEHQQWFMGESVQLDGSMRGFELFSISNPANETELYLFLNEISDRDGIRDVFRALEKLMLN